jgi:hypothetical protein
VFALCTKIATLSHGSFDKELVCLSFEECSSYSILCMVVLGSDVESILRLLSFKQSLLQSSRRFIAFFNQSLPNVRNKRVANCVLTLVTGVLF